MDKRQFSRVKFEMTALIEKDGVVYEGAIRDLSLKGMLVESEDAFANGDEVSISIQLTGQASSLQVDVKGKVIRKESDLIALTFTEIDIDSFIHLKNIVSYNDGDPEKIEHEFVSYIKNNINHNEEI